MSLFFRSQPERRAITGDEWIRGLESTSSRTKAGVIVTPNRAMKLGAVWAVTNLLASIVSDLPVDVFRGANKQPVVPQPPLVARPSLIVTRRQWVYQAMMSLLLRGNAYGLVVERDGALRPKTVEWLNPDAITVRQESSLGRPSYEINGNPIPAVDVVHLRAFVQPGSAIGLSPVEYHAEMIGVGLGAQQFGAQWFGEGGHPTALFQNKARTLDPDQTAKIKERIVATLKGRREPLVVGSDWDYKQIQVSANESQFLESMGYTDAQIARLYGPGLAEILGYATQGSSLTYSNRVDRSLDVLTYSVMHWLGLFEDFLTESIAQPQTAKFNVKALLRADPKAQHEMFRIDREIGLKNVDEIRDLLDDPPLPDGQGQDYTPIPLQPAPTSGGSDVSK